MKKIFIIPLALTFVILITAVSMANLNVINLLVSDTTYGSDGSGEMFTNKDIDPERQYLKGTTMDGNGNDFQESIQSGLSGGKGTLNLLYILQNAKNIDKKSYAYSLLDSYGKLYDGVYNDYKHHIPPTAIAGLHYNETKLASFIAPYAKDFGKGNQAKGKTLDKSYKKDAVSAPGASVYAKDRYGDQSCPDGPLQIIWCKNKTPIDKRDDKRDYDPYHFPDNLNYIDHAYQAAIKMNGGKEYADPIMSTAYSSLSHNRGTSGVVRQLHGVPFNGGPLKSSLIEGLSDKDRTNMLEFFKTFSDWVDKSNAPTEDLVGTESTYGTGLVTLFTLANGGFIEEPLRKHTKNGISNVPTRTIKKLFPGQTSKTIVNHINNKYVKHPWDVAGISKSKYQKLYGLQSDLYRNSYDPGGGRNYILYYEKKLTSTNYKNGKNVNIMRVFDGVSGGYFYDTSITGDFILLKIAMAAGIKSLKDESVIDPSNPNNTNKSNENSGQYAPTIDGTGNFSELMRRIGLDGKLSKGTQEQFNAMYKYSGGIYSQGLRGTTDKNTGLMRTDCSVYVTLGMEMGKRSGTLYPTTSWIPEFLMSGKKNKKGYKVYAKQLTTSGKLMKNYKKGTNSQYDASWHKVAKPGDIINKRNSHVYAFIKRNTSSKTIVIPPDISKTTASGSTVKPGQTMTFESSGYQKERGNKMGFGHHGDDTGHGLYEMFRPSFSAHYK